MNSIKSLYLLSIVSGLIIFFSLNLGAQNKQKGHIDYIDTLSIKEFSSYCKIKNSLDYMEVWKKAKRLFKVGKKIQTPNFEFYFKECHGPLTSSLSGNSLIEYCIFGGSNGIIGQEIVLFINNENEIVKLEIIGWGR